MDFQLSLESEVSAQPTPTSRWQQRPTRASATCCSCLRAQRTGAVLICEGPKLVGILTERDALKLMARGADFSTPVREVMSSPPATIARPRDGGRGDPHDGRGRLPPSADRRRASTSRRACWRSTASSIIWWTIFRKPCTTCPPIRRPDRGSGKEHNESPARQRKLSGGIDQSNNNE